MSYPKANSSQDEGVFSSKMRTKVAFGQREVEISAIIYDKDGTLLDSFGTDVLPMIMRSELIADKLNKGEPYARKLQQRLGYDPKSKNIDYGSPALVGTHQETQIVFATLLYQDGYNFREMLDLVGQVYAEVWKNTDWSKTITTVSGVRQALESQRRGGVKIAVATNDDTELAKIQLQTAGLSDLVDVILGADTVGAAKPDPALLIETCKILGVNPADVALVGDSVGDMMAGRNARLRLLVGVVEGSRTNPELLSKEADIVIDSIRSIRII